MRGGNWADKTLLWLTIVQMVWSQAQLHQHCLELSNPFLTYFSLDLLDTLEGSGVHASLNNTDLYYIFVMGKRDLCTA